MLYRKAPPQAPRLLLRIAAGAGAVGLAVACGASSSNGFITEPEGADAGDAGDDGSLDAEVVLGVLACGPGTGFQCPGVIVRPDAGDDATAPCDGGPCGSVRLGIDGGIAVPPDAASDAEPSDDAADTGVHCPGVCGVIVHLEE